jgi:hypothetical protein
MAAAWMTMVMTAAWRRRPMAAPHHGGSLSVSVKVETMVS